MPFRARFIPRHPEKYVGDPNDIWCRSSWEVTVCKYFDSRPDVVHWGSEELVIPYLSPEDNKVHRYFPDFFVEYLDKEGITRKEIVEVKPRNQSEEKYAKSDYSKAALSVNDAKWKAASLFCETRGMKFRVLTERSIFLQKKKVDGGV